MGTARKTQAKCLIEGCGKPARSRGLCVACLASARRKLAKIANEKARKRRERELIDAGLMLPARVKSCRFSETYERTIEQKQTA